MKLPQRVVDLTQRLGPDTVMWPGTEPPRFSLSDSYAADGSFSRTVTLSEHSGTHLDAPAHFVPGGATVDEIPASRLVCLLAVVDVRSRTFANPGYSVTVADLEADEKQFGKIADASAVAICTGWASRNSEAGSYLGLDQSGGLCFPGVSPEAAAWLVEHRSICGLGIDTAGVDPGSDKDYRVHRDVTLPRGVWHLEGLVNLELVPARGALIFVGALALLGGSGAPARVMAVV